MLRKSALVLAAVCGSAAFATAAAVLPDLTAQAETSARASVQLTEENASLFLPGSREQYLELDTPSDAAFSDGYIAIADGGTIYLSVRGSEQPYTSYEVPGEDATVTKLQFVGNTLYFTVRSTYNSFWKYDCGTQTAEQVNSLNCSTFLIVGNTLYTAVISGSGTSLARRDLNDLSGQGVSLGTISERTEPWLAYAGETLYCTVGDQIYHPGPDGTFRDEWSYYISNDTTVNRLISSLCSDGTDLYCSSASGFYRRAPQEGETPVRLSDASGMSRVSSLSYYNGAFYCIRGASVCEIAADGTSASFTGYEIAAASSSQNRTDSASDIARAGDLVVTADAGNFRISVYDSAADSFTVLPCSETPDLVATDGSVISYAAGTQVYTCNYAAGETQFSSAELRGTEVVGLSVRFGETYYVKGNGTRGVVGGTTIETSTSPTGLASDLYGTFYIAYANGSVRSYTQSEFLSRGMGTDTGISLPADARSLRADFMGNLYCLSGGALYCNGQLFAAIDGSDFVYGASVTRPVSFALGYEDEAVYLQFGNYTVRTHTQQEDGESALSGIPTLSEIETGSAREAAFSHHDEDVLVKIAAQEVGITVDLASLKEGGETFPYLDYGRYDEAREGILLADASSNAGGYALVLLSDESGGYTARLYRGTAVTDAEEQSWTQGQGETRYLSSPVSSYYAPCLAAPLGEVRLERGTQVTLLGTLDAPDRTYALISYESGARAQKRGWVPLSYLTSVSPSPDVGEEYMLSFLKAAPAGVVFTREDGAQRVVTERTQVQLFANGDGTYTARLSDDPAYSAVVTKDMLDDDSAEAVRIALIVILTVLALIIIGMYVFLLPREKYRKKRR